MDKKVLISIHNNACAQVSQIETVINNVTIESNNQKDKANFGNLCIALKGFRMVAEATEAMLMNENCLKGEDGFFYDRVNLDEPKTEKKEDAAGSKSE